MPEITLASLMDTAHEAALAIASREELNAPMLAYVRPDGTVGGAVLNVPDVHPSDQAKIVLASERATMAALCMESWKVEVEITPEQREAFKAGKVPRLGMQPREHPDRYDALVLVGEVRGQPQVQRHWRIRTDPVHGARTFEEQEVPEGSPQPSRFTPLFAPDAEVDRLVYEYLTQARLRNEAQEGRN